VGLSEGSAVSTASTTRRVAPDTSEEDEDKDPGLSPLPPQHLEPPLWILLSTGSI
jgi:hypothetical protein